MCAAYSEGVRVECGVRGDMWRYMGAGREDYDIRRKKYNNERKSTYMRYINADTRVKETTVRTEVCK